MVWTITHRSAAAKRGDMQRMHYCHSAASQPLALLSLSGLMRCNSNVGTKEVTSRMETRQTSSLRRRKEQNLNVVRAGKKVNQERKPLGMPSSWTTPPSPHPDTPPETNLPTRTSRVLWEFKSGAILACSKLNSFL